MAFNILLSPFWIAYTDAYVKKDFNWMKNVYNHLTNFYYLAVVIGLIMFLLSSSVYKLWLPDYVEIPWDLSLAMCLYILILSYSNMLMILINGTGKVFMQMLIYVFCAIIAIPLMIILCKHFGIIGLLIVLGAVYTLQSIIAKIQLNRILKGTASGIWNK